MICGFCHKEIDEQVGSQDGQTPCGRCFGGCRLIHCPHCGYANPAPGKLLSRLLKKKDKRNE
jgi:adenine-specific DNA methylase